MVQGVADGSFGVEVAKLAHLPQSVIDRSQELLGQLTIKEKLQVAPGDQELMDAYERILSENRSLKESLVTHGQKNRLEEELGRLSLDELSPRQAFETLWRWKENAS